MKDQDRDRELPSQLLSRNVEAATKATKACCSIVRGPGMADGQCIHQAVSEIVLQRSMI